MTTAFVISTSIAFSSAMLLMLLAVAYTFVNDDSNSKARDILYKIGIWLVRILIVSIVLMCVTLVLAPVPKFWNVY